MVRIKEEMGFWKAQIVKSLLYYEYCSNESCSAGELHYPIFQKTAQCPTCRADLVGPQITKNATERIIHHLGEK